MSQYSILWRRLDQPGHEIARLVSELSGWHLIGAAVFTHKNRPCWLSYEIQCKATWVTRSARVIGWIGNDRVSIEVNVTSAQHWEINGKEVGEVEGCIDLDLNFSPVTNMLPVRRLSLAIGQGANVKAAWLRLPSFDLEPLEQIYRRVDTASYRYETADGHFRTDLQVNEAGFVVEYPDLWKAESFS